MEKEGEIRKAIYDYYINFINEDGSFDEINHERSAFEGELMSDIGEELFGNWEYFDENELFDEFFELVDKVIEEEEDLEIVKKYFEVQ